jgi:TetR/AcrR family transcriptional regulator, mexJK operon transcriptional repressor
VIVNLAELADRPRLRPQAERARERILDAAEAEFLAHGFSGASTNTIVARSGAARSTVFTHFPTKQLMFAAVFQRLTIRMLAELEQIDSSEEEPAKFLQAYGAKMLAFHLDPRSIFVTRVLVAETVRFPELVEAYAAVGPDRAVTILAERFERWAKEGRVRSKDHEDTARRFIYGLISYRVMAQMMRPEQTMTPEKVEAATAAAVDTFLHGHLIR